MASSKKWPSESERDSLLYNDNNKNRPSSSRSPTDYTQLPGRNEPINRHHRNVQNDSLTRRPSIRRLMTREYPRPLPIRWTKALGKTGCSFTIILVIVFILLIVFKVWFNLTANPTYVIQIDPLESTSKISNIHNDSELILVNVLFRHGDRSPEYLNHLGMQQLKPHVDQIWPRGLQNLTDIGRLRMFKIGLELSRLYRFPLSAYNSSNILALSSNFPRCIESTESVLRGFYNSETTTLDESIEELIAIDTYCQIDANKFKKVEQSSQSRLCNLLANSSTDFATNEWKNIQIDTQSLVALRSKFVVDNCPKFNKTNCIIYDNLNNSQNLTSMAGFRELQEHISLPFGIPFNYDLINFYGSLNPILKLSSLPVVRKALLPHIKWIAQQIDIDNNDSEANGNGNSNYNRNHNLTLLKTYDALNMMADTICVDSGMASKLQNYPLITSIIESQASALDQADNIYTNNSSLSSKIYKDKKLILYGTHDTIIESLLNQLNVRKRIDDGHSYLQEYKHVIKSNQANNDDYKNAHNHHHELNGLISGIRRAEPGASLVFELWKTRDDNDNKNSTSNGMFPVSNAKQFPYVRLLIYQREDPIHQRIQFERVKLGSVCRRTFLGLHPSNDQVELEKFFSMAPVSFNRDFDCPFELWKNITSNQMMSHETFQNECYK